MFPRVVKVKHKEKVYEYLRLVESYRDERGKVCQRNLLSLGRVDQLGDGRLDDLVDKLRRFCKSKFVTAEEIESDEAISWGPVLVARHLWKEMGLDRIIGELCQGKKRTFDVAENAFLLVANRLCEPKSEHGLARWLEHTYVCDSKGVRFLPKWREDGQITKDSRVRVAWDQLDQWYRTLDAVYAKKKQIERELYLRLRDLFSLKVDMVFYDITALSFAGKHDKGDLGRHGYPHGSDPRKIQVLFGLVMVGGFPIAGHVFRGNTADKTTVPEVIQDLEERFGVGRIIFVADKGMVSPKNLLALVNNHYILGHKGRRDKDAANWLSKLTEHWKPCDEGTRVQEVPSGRKDIRVIIVESDERKQNEERLRLRSMERAEKHLSKVARAVEKGRLKSKEKIAVRADRALRKNKGYRYFSYRVEGDGRFTYWLDAEKMQAETLREGRYILTTDHPHISLQEAVAQYKNLSDIEETFKDFKGVIEARPIHHQRDDRICAHLFIAQLALLLLRQLKHHLDKKNILLSPKEAIAAVRCLGISEMDLSGEKRLYVPPPKRDAKRVLTALGITDRHPPGTNRRRTTENVTENQK